MKTITYISLLLTLLSCNKFLDKKSDISLIIPSELSDYQKLLDNATLVNNSSAAALGMIGSDEYYLTEPVYASANYLLKNGYIWKKDIFEGNTNSDWNRSYSNIYTSNVVIDGLNKFKVTSTSEKTTKDYLLGQAFFIRANFHFLLEEVFGNIYIANSDNEQLGIPIRQNSDLSAPAQRSSVKSVYNFIISDIKSAIQYLNNNSIPRNRPTKAAAFALLARVYLSMHNYAGALINADSSLAINSFLQDYNKLSTTSTRPFSSFASPNELGEVLYPVTQVNYSFLTANTLAVDTNLYRSYQPDDLRRSIYYNTNSSTKTQFFKGQYSGTTSFNSGPFTDEMYLIRAECNVRAGNLSKAFEAIDTLLTKRYVSGKYIPYSTSNVDEALAYVLKERKKELAFRGLRWIDLRRLNQDTNTQTTLKRIIGGTIYELLPNDKRYVYPIPIDEIQYSGIQQNER